MQQAQWFESKKGYTVNFDKGRFTVFWTGDTGAPWRTVHNGHFSDGFKTVFDAVDAVEAAAGENGRRGNMVDLDPSVRQRAAEEARAKREAEEAAKQNARKDSGWNRFRQAEAEDLKKAFNQHFTDESSDFTAEHFEKMFRSSGFTNANKTAGTGPSGNPQQDEWIKRTFGFDPAAEFAKAAQARRDEQARMNAEWMRRQREKQQQQHNQQRGDPDAAQRWFEELLRRTRGPFHQQQQQERAAPPRPTTSKREWRAVLELPLSGPLDPAAVKAQFRKLAMKHHPDREGGSTEKMAELNTAWDQACAALNIR